MPGLALPDRPGPTSPTAYVKNYNLLFKGTYKELRQMKVSDDER